MYNYFSSSEYLSWSDGPLPYFSYGLPFNQSNWISTYQAFSSIGELPHRHNLFGIYGQDNYCKFQDYSTEYCVLWSAQVGSNNGHVSQLGWDFTSR